MAMVGVAMVVNSDCHAVQVGCHTKRSKASLFTMEVFSHYFFCSFPSLVGTPSLHMLVHFMVCRISEALLNCLPSIFSSYGIISICL